MQWTSGCALAAVLAVSMAWAETPIQPFQARYALYGAGLPVGEGELTLRAVGADGYTLRLTARPNAMVAWLASHQMDEQASGIIRQGRVQPLRYERQTATGDERQHLRLHFDWAAAQVQVQSRGEPINLALSPGTTDPLSLNLAVMSDLQRGRLPDHYTLVDGAETRVYRIRQEGHEVLNTALGALHTTRISQTRPDGKRTTTFWFAADFGYAPVQITRQKNGREDLRLEIRTLDPTPR